MAPLSYKRKRVDNSDIEEQRITNYEAVWREMDESLTELSAVIDSHILVLDHLHLSMNYLKDVLMICAGKVPKSIKEKESNQISCNRKAAHSSGLGEQQVHDKQPRFQSGRSSYNVATNFEALKMEMDEFLARVDSFIKQVFDHLHSLCTRTGKIKPNISLILDMLKKAHSSPASIREIPASK